MIQIVGLIYECLVTYDFTVVINKDVTHDCVHPSFKICIGNIFFLVIQGL